VSQGSTPKAEAPPGDPIWSKNLAFSMVNRAHC
jgi:hypothetical protein